MQDKHGHSDYYAREGILPTSDNTQAAANADKVDHYYFDLKTGVKIEHFEDVIKSRDETYNILGRFYKEYSNVIMRR